MSKLKSALLGLTALSLTAGYAMAADLAPAPYIPPQEAVPAPIYDQAGWYLRGDLGWSFLSSDIGRKNDNAFTGGLGVGYRFNNTFRGDITADYSGKYDVGNNKIDAWTVLANGYVDIPLSDTIVPYLGAGAGYGWVDGKHSYSEDGFTAAAMAGVGFKVSDSVTLDVGYRFRDAFIDGPNFLDHSVRAGLRFAF
ncbi:outer membrane protein [Rhodoligotrophos defluvii]|uniref:outer membrane protein n=1 Tax=Rhodoligotrophos defluvii TaxID=2561934 RepID=UPI0010C9E243|nr:outer membrane beta-barrel protein [Rhodoligotrophos defluvii]